MKEANVNKQVIEVTYRGRPLFATVSPDFQLPHYVTYIIEFNDPESKMVLKVNGNGQWVTGNNRATKLSALLGDKIESLSL
jgi:hypothetical protein